MLVFKELVSPPKLRRNQFLERNVVNIFGSALALGGYQIHSQFASRICITFSEYGPLVIQGEFVQSLVSCMLCGREKNVF